MYICSFHFAATSFIDDIGSIITAEMAPKEIEDKVKKLSSAQKFHLLKHHVVPMAILSSQLSSMEDAKVFPVTIVEGISMDGGLYGP